MPSCRMPLLSGLFVVACSMLVGCGGGKRVVQPATPQQPTDDKLVAQYQFKWFDAYKNRANCDQHIATHEAAVATANKLREAYMQKLALANAALKAGNPEAPKLVNEVEELLRQLLDAETNLSKLTQMRTAAVDWQLRATREAEEAREAYSRGRDDRRVKEIEREYVVTTTTKEKNADLEDKLRNAYFVAYAKVIGDQSVTVASKNLESARGVHSQVQAEFEKARATAAASNEKKDRLVAEEALRRLMNAQIKVKEAEDGCNAAKQAAASTRKEYEDAFHSVLELFATK